MNFSANGTPMTHSGLMQVVDTLNINQAVLWAVLKVESSGFGYLADRRPKILFERHIFHKQTQGQYRSDYPDISNPQAGGYQGGAAEYSRLQEAIALDLDCALKSTSWGIGQIMGFNHGIVGYDAVQTMVAHMVQSEDEQIMAMVKFMQYNGLDDALHQQDWRAFARGYNGADYVRNQYDKKLTEAYSRAQTSFPDLGLRTAQAALLYLGFNPGPVDGLWGVRTRSALCAYQSLHDLPEKLDTATQEMLLAAAFSPD